jgi:hypothetical protein
MVQLDHTNNSLALVLAGLHQRLDQLPDTIGGDLQVMLADTERAIQRLNAIKLKIVDAADAVDVSHNSGLADTSAWVAKHTRTATASAASQVRLARSLATLPTAGTALAAGVVSADHVAVIAHTHRQLPITLNNTQREQVETKLVRLAKVLDPPTLRRQARRVLDEIASQETAAQHHDQVLRDEEAQARAKTKLTLHDNGDGTTSGHFTVPTLAGDVLHKIIQQITAPRRTQLRASQAQVGSAEEKRDWGHLSGLALVELIEHLPTDRLHGKVAATIVVTMQHEQLLRDLAAASTDTGSEVSASEARRMACGVVRVCCRLYSTANHRCLTWVAPSDCSPKVNALRSLPGTKPASLTAVHAHLPGANSTTGSLGHTTATPTSKTPNPFVTGTTNVSTTPTTHTNAHPTAQSNFTAEPETRKNYPRQAQVFRLHGAPHEGMRMPE